MLSPVLQRARPSYMPKYAPPSSCVLYLEGQQDAYSATIKDLSGNNNHGTIYGATWTRLPSGLWGLDFDGSDDKVVVTHNANQLLTTGGTILSWFKADTIGETAGRIVDKSESTVGGNGYELHIYPANTVGFTVNGGSTITTAAIVTYGVWWFHAVTFAANATVTHYLNGVVTGTPAATGALAGITTTNDLTIGNYAVDTTRTFDGIIALPRIFNVVLTATQIANIYNQERHLFGVQAYEIRRTILECDI